MIRQKRQSLLVSGIACTLSGTNNSTGFVGLSAPVWTRHPTIERLRQPGNSHNLASIQSYQKNRTLGCVGFTHQLLCALAVVVENAHSYPPLAGRGVETREPCAPHVCGPRGGPGARPPVS